MFFLGSKFESNHDKLNKNNLGRDLQKAFPVNLPVITQRVTIAKSVLPFRELNKYFLYRWIFEFFSNFRISRAPQRSNFSPLAAVPSINTSNQLKFVEKFLPHQTFHFKLFYRFTPFLLLECLIVRNRFSSRNWLWSFTRKDGKYRTQSSTL